jgi:glycosyltransferase involved in cell wall biosynthesis
LEAAQQKTNKQLIIGVLGTRGIPNYHGGFEQFAEFFSIYLVEQGHEVFVYNSSTHPYKDKEFKGAKIIHCFDPENRIGTSGQFIYDLNCIIDSRKRKFDVLLQLGYTSSSVWHKLLPKNAIVITNMDGLEWKRSKYSKKVQKFLRYSEKLAAMSSDFLVADSIGIQTYLKEQYNLPSKYIPYGAEPFDRPNETVLESYGLTKGSYDMLIARLEPENNIETILDGVDKSNTGRTFLVVGKHDVNQFGIYLKDKFKHNQSIKFLGGIYDLNDLNNLRYYSNLYFHGHSVGGTNPSLLEAMASHALIIAHNNEFNNAILQNNSMYFENSEEVRNYLEDITKSDYLRFVENNITEIKNNFNWEKINSSYLDYINECMVEKHI